MEKRGSGMEPDQCEQHIGANLVRFREDVADGVILLEQRRNLPDQQLKRRRETGTCPSL